MGDREISLGMSEEPLTAVDQRFVEVKHEGELSRSFVGLAK